MVEPTSKRPDTVSSLVRHLEKTLPEDQDMTIGQFLGLLGVHGFVFFLLVLSMLNVIIFMVPGLSILFGVPMVILVVQMLLGIRVPIFPDVICDRKIKSSLLQKGLQHAAYVLEKVERYIRPRFLILTNPNIIWVHSLVALVLGFMVAIPVPFLNLPPTFGMMCLAMGLMQRDGIFVGIAYTLAVWSFWLYQSVGSAAHNLVW